MNCPAHVVLFKEYNLSYKNLPFRIAEFGSCFRNEDQGGVVGLKRVRNLHQDDGHIFCSLEHIESEIKSFLKDADIIYKLFGFEDYIIKLATRPEKYIGSLESWEIAENSLKKSLEGLNYILVEGDGAFYGPKIELHLKDNLGRMWQCGTIQVDFNLGERLNAYYINNNNEKITPIILHRAILGSLERFIAVLLENGQLPNWLQPINIRILPISEKFFEYSLNIYENLKKIGYRCDIDLENDTLGKKLKRVFEAKINNCVIIGQSEVDNQKITLRKNNENITMNLNEIVNYVKI
jgi:threonyl-tRNA synthetase